MKLAFVCFVAIFSHCLLFADYGQLLLLFSTATTGCCILCCVGRMFRGVALLAQVL